MKKLNNQELAIVEALGAEIKMMNDLIAWEQDDEVLEELKQERMALVARMNGMLGTEHIMRCSTIEVINNVHSA